jgi:glycosyltransferase involved in cell wall biosynthesis
MTKKYLNSNPLITVVIPSLNQGLYIEESIKSILNQDLPIEIFIMDGGSDDFTLEIIKKWEFYISGWQSQKDGGQAAAINKGIKLGKAPFVCWLNSDDYFLPNSLSKLLKEFNNNQKTPVIYGKSLNFDQKFRKFSEINVESFSKNRLSKRCIISQPATLIRRNSFEEVGGLNTNFSMSMDYDLWWRLFLKFGDFVYINEYIAVNRDHEKSKSRNFKYKHFIESIQIVKHYNQKISIRWYFAYSYSLFIKPVLSKFLYLKK